MSEIDEIDSRLTEFTHDLFISPQYTRWRSNILNQKRDRWYSLIVELDKSNSNLDAIKGFGEDVYSKLVYRCIPCPITKALREDLVLFNVAGSIWHSLIYFSANERAGKDGR